MLFNGKLCERRSVPRQDFLSAAFKCVFEVSRSVQRAVSHAKTNMCCQWFPPLEAALILYNDSRPFSTTPATDATRKKKKSNTENYRHGFLPITDCSANQLSVPINRKNRWIGRPLVGRCHCIFMLVFNLSSWTHWIRCSFKILQKKRPSMRRWCCLRQNWTKPFTQNANVSHF